MTFNTQSIILASTSKARKAMLTAAGLEFVAHRPEVDEAALQNQFQNLSPRVLAAELARAKALSVSKQHRQEWVIGADQTLEFEGRICHKANSINEAKINLQSFSGKSHLLHSSLCVAKNGQNLFTHTATAKLTMRPLSQAFIELYTATEQEALLGSVGGYHYEDAGVNLFEKVQGDIHTILGLPLLPLLAFLRDQAIIPA